MNATTMNFNMYALAAPKAREDLFALADEMLNELDQINIHFDGIFEQAECLSDA